MKYSIAFAAILGMANAHSMVTHFWNNGKADQSCVRRAVNTNPVMSVDSENMACNVVKGSTMGKCSVQAGSTVGFEYRTWPDTPAENVPLKMGKYPVSVTDTSHKGPCAVYAKKVDDAATAKGPGDGWFKIYHEAVGTDGKFCTTRLREKNLPLEVTLPECMEDGDYLLRAEYLALNNAAPTGEAESQFYPGCVQVTISGGQQCDSKPVIGAIPGYVKPSDPGMLFNIWEEYPEAETPEKPGAYANYPKVDELFGLPLYTGAGSPTTPEGPKTSAPAPVESQAPEPVPKGPRPTEPETPKESESPKPAPEELKPTEPEVSEPKPPKPTKPTPSHHPAPCNRHCPAWKKWKQQQGKNKGEGDCDKAKE